MFKSFLLSLPICFSVFGQSLSSGSVVVPRNLVAGTALKIGDGTTQIAAGGASVLVYGAKCDGVTDDRVAIQAALTAAAGQTVQFPDALTCIVSPIDDKTQFLTLPPGTLIRGHGTLKVKSGSAPYDSVLFSADCSGCDIEDITIDANVAGNPIANFAEFAAFHIRVEIAIFGGNPVTIKGVTIKNSSASNSIDVNGSTVGSVLIADCQFLNMGDDPNHVVHDMSSIYTNTGITGGAVVTRNRFRAAVVAAPAAYTAIETHGSGTAVANNTITNYANGINTTGEDSTDTEATVVANNTITGAMLCIEIWSSQNGSHTSGYGINGLVVEGNSCRLNQYAYSGANVWGGSTATWGILIDPNANMPVANVKIANNMIVFDPETTVHTGNTTSFGIGWFSVKGVAAENFTIENNTIDNAPVNAIRVIASSITGLKITGNTIRNAGSSLDSLINIGYKVPFYLQATAGPLQGECSFNNITDTFATTRIPRPWFIQGTDTTNSLQMLDNTVTLLGADQSSWLGYFSGLVDDFVKPLVRMYATSQPWTIPAHAIRAGSMITEVSTGNTYRLPADGTGWLVVPLTQPSARR